jgi:hypothetical protein
VVVRELAVKAMSVVGLYWKLILAAVMLNHIDDF